MRVSHIGAQEDLTKYVVAFFVLAVQSTQQVGDAPTDLTMGLVNRVSTSGLQIEDDLVREGIRVLIQAVIETEVTQRISAEPYECSPACVTWRNGYRERAYVTRVGEVTLQVPKVWEGSYLPSFLAPICQVVEYRPCPAREALLITPLDETLTPT